MIVDSTLYDDCHRYSDYEIDCGVQEKALDENSETFNVKPSDYTSFAMKVPVAGGLSDFSFDERRYLLPIYNTSSKRVLLKCGRQTEKTCLVTSLISTYNGRLKKAGEVQVGDALSNLSIEDGASTETEKVTWVSKRYTKPCVRIRTRQNHTTEVATTHPMRAWDSWTPAGDIKVGDKLGVVRRCGEFGTEQREFWEICLTAYMIGDGSTSSGNFNFTKFPGPVFDEFCTLLSSIGDGYRIQNKKGTVAKTVSVRKGSLTDSITSSGLKGKRSGEKFIPDWVFNLPRKEASIFLNRLWATDGHVKKRNNRNNYQIAYSSTSYKLVRQLQALMWKFGVPTRIRDNWPNYWKKQGIRKMAYILHVETQPGVVTFLKEIGARGKSESVPLPTSAPNSNRDTYPDKVNEILHKALKGVPYGYLSERYGLRKKPKYRLTPAKLAQYIDALRDINPELANTLSPHVKSDIYWDEVVEIENIGEQECVDFTVGRNHNFVCDGFITHNSTTLGNKLLTYAALVPYFKSLYVSPSHTQTKVFSRDRIKEPIQLSPQLGSLSNPRLLSNILEKKFINGSQITLRFAFLNADRVRGIPTDKVLIDEIQDILLENIPVIEECASHSPYKLFTYSGTPKSLDNTIEAFWAKRSTQNEWVVPCRAHGTPKDPGSWHWNVLDEENMGLKGLICDKCGAPIYAQDPNAQWASLNPNPNTEQPFEGYRIPQLMVPWLEWSDLKNKQKSYSRAKFYNEVLGLSYDSGTRPLTRQDVIDNCNPQLSMTKFREIQRKYSAQVPIFAGIDWGSSENSYTVLTLAAYLPFDPDMFTVFYAHRFEGLESDPKEQIRILVKILREFNVSYIGVDYGGGFWPNDELVREFGAHKVKKYQWVGRVKKKIQYDAGLAVPRYLCHRTEVMSDIFNAIKRRDVFRFPRWEEFEDPYASDMLNIFSEYNEMLRMNVYKHAMGRPDDTMHSILFNFLASFHQVKRPDVLMPTQEMNREVYEYDDLDIT